MARLIKVDGTIEKLKPAGKYLSLQELQKAVDGYIETVTVDKENLLIVNEEGRLKQLPVNEIASSMVLQMIVGDVVLLKMSEMEQ